MAKSSTLKGVVVLILVAVITFMAWHTEEEETSEVIARLLPTYQTSAVRTNNVNKYCSSSISRSQLSSSDDISSAKSNRNTVTAALGIDGNLLIGKVANGDTSGAISMIQSNQVGLGLYVGAFLVPFVFFLFLWPFICCCCVCPSCCPSKCCQQPEDKPYTQCQLMWPSVVTIMALLLIISASIYGFVNHTNMGQTFRNMACSMAIFTDDMLNGNETLDKTSYFTGLHMFSASLNDFNGNLSNIQTQLNDFAATSSGTSYTDVSNIATVQNTYVKIIPDNAGTGTMNLLYNTPINASPTTGTLQSTFSAILGQYTANSTLVGALYYSIQYARLTMQAIKDNSNVFSSQTGTISGQINNIKTTIDSLASDVSTMDNNMGSFLSYFRYPGDYTNMGMQAIYGYFIGLSFFCLLGLLLMVCCDKIGCRHLMYLSCLFLFLGGLIAYIIAVATSIMVPAFTWTCQYIDVAVSSQAGFSANFQPFLSTTTINQISKCMPFSNGNIVDTVAGAAADGINNLTSVISKLSAFDNVTLNSYITGNLTLLENTVNAYANGDISDLDSTNNNILALFSDPSTTSIYSGCTITDSWVPSNAQNSSYSTAISCKSSSGHTGEIANCNSALAGVNCDGCMDMTQLLTAYANSAAVTSAITSHYAGTCNTFGTKLGNLWTNYFNIKYTILGYPSALTSPAGTVQDRIQTAKPKITDTTDLASVFSSINQFRGKVDTVNGNLASIQTLTDAKYGMLAGLNCKLFGEDFVTFQNVICSSFYNSLYSMRLTFGIAAWGILFVMMCAVCSGVRHFKQQGRVKKISDNFMNDFDNASKHELHKKDLEKY